MLVRSTSDSSGFVVLSGASAQGDGHVNRSIDVNTPQKKGAALRVLSMDVHQPVGII